MWPTTWQFRGQPACGIGASSYSRISRRLEAEAEPARTVSNSRSAGIEARRSRFTEGIEHDRPVAVAATFALVRGLTGKLRPCVDPLEQYVRAGLELSG